MASGSSPIEPLLLGLLSVTIAQRWHSPRTGACARSLLMGLDMPLREAMETQRAIRRLKPDPVDDQIVLRCIELALKAPTGSNAQNWQWIVVRDPEVKARLAKYYRQSWRIYGGLGGRLRGGGPKTKRILDAVPWQV